MSSEREKDKALFEETVQLGERVKSLASIIQNGSEHVVDAEYSEWLTQYIAIVRDLSELPLKVRTNIDASRGTVSQSTTSMEYKKLLDTTQLSEYVLINTVTGNYVVTDATFEEVEDLQQAMIVRGLSVVNDLLATRSHYTYKKVLRLNARDVSYISLSHF